MKKQFFTKKKTINQKMPVKKKQIQPTNHSHQPTCALGSPCFGSMVTKSRPSLDGSVRPPGGFSKTNSQATPREAFLSSEEEFRLEKSEPLWEDILVEKNLAFFVGYVFFCLLSTCKWMNIYEYL